MTDIAIIGGGFSGTLLAVNLVRHEGPRAVLVERRHDAGLGLAYSTASPSHLLNVRAANMSALPDDPGHFERWAAENCQATRSCFVARADYGRYLNALVTEACADAPGQLTVASAEVVAMDRTSAGFVLQFGDGTATGAREVILATGNLPAGAMPGFDAAALGRAYVAEPWKGDLGADLPPDEPVLLIGTGLTAVDAALLLRDGGHRGPIIAVSRRGLIPRVHGDAEPVPVLKSPPAATALAILRHLRRRSAEIGWRAAIDQLRPHSQTLWRKMPLAERRRFLRHARTWWDVHRHRMAPPVAARIGAMIDDGSLRIAAGRILGARPVRGGAQVDIRLRGGTIERMEVARIINCTGPGELQGTDHPLLRSLLASGLARPDALGLGLDTDHLGRVIGRDGRVTRGLYAVGPLTRGSFWEITAVPDIRLQVWSLARLLANARWVGGEGL